MKTFIRNNNYVVSRVQPIGGYIHRAYVLDQEFRRLDLTGVTALAEYSAPLGVTVPAGGVVLESLSDAKGLTGAVELKLSKAFVDAVFAKADADLQTPRMSFTVELTKTGQTTPALRYAVFVEFEDFSYKNNGLYPKDDR